MKLTKSKLKQLVREEIDHLVKEQPDAAAPELRSSLGKQLAKRIAAAPTIQQSLAQLKEKDQLQRTEFVAYFAQLLDVDLTDRDVSRTRSAQKTMQGSIEPSPEEV